MYPGFVSIKQVCCADEKADFQLNYQLNEESKWSFVG
jgi:hypothetical protein